ncbi:MAG: hypothetical protein ACI4MH_06730 [Candidatus Coproplasma sp.]
MKLDGVGLFVENMSELPTPRAILSEQVGSTALSTAESKLTGEPQLSFFCALKNLFD